MGKNFIGKRIRLQIGGKPLKEEDDAIIGEDINIHMSNEEAAKYDSIIGEKVDLKIGPDVDRIVQDIISTINNSDEQDKEKITRLCKEILSEQNKKAKLQKIRNLISIGASVASICTFILQLKATIGM